MLMQYVIGWILHYFVYGTRVRHLLVTTIGVLI